MKKIILSAIALALSSAVLNVQASTVMVLDHAAWEVAVQNKGYDVTLIDFENVVNGGTWIAAGEVTFTTPDPLNPISAGSFEVLAKPFLPYDSGNAMWADFNQGFNVDLPDNTYAFGLEFGDMGLLGPTYSLIPSLNAVQLSTGDFFPGPYWGALYPGRTFVGFISNTIIDSLYFQVGGFEGLVDNFVYARKPEGTVPVPEPATMLLVCSGILGVVIRRKR